MKLVPGALKDLKQNKIADQQGFSLGCGFQFGSCGRSVTAQVRNPHGAVDENHDRRGGLGATLSSE